MLTPKFKLTQDSENIHLWMHVPYIKYEDAECEISEGNILFFSASPYYLRLHLPGDVLLESGPSHYDMDAGDLTINLKKQNPGESFQGLDMLTWLLTPRKTKHYPNIETIDLDREYSEVGNTTGNGNGNNPSDFQDSALSSLTGEEEGATNSQISAEDTLTFADDEMDWFIDQKLREPETHLPDIKKTGCGFALQRLDFSDISSEAAYLIDVKDPNNLNLSERRRLREKQEDDKFNCEHYLADLYDDDTIKGIMVPFYPQLTGKDGVPSVFIDKEAEKLLQLPKREYLIESDMLSHLYFGLVDLMFAYAYTYRFSLGEDNVEADWTICKLSSMLSWCDSFSNIKDVVVACARRSLCFPLYRSWALFGRVLDDVKLILRCGKTQILKCLLSIHVILQESEDRYVLNDLYVTDYCVWIQAASAAQIERLADDLSTFVISKAAVGFNLIELETDARCVMEESDGDDDVTDLADRVRNVVKVCDADDRDSDDDNVSSSESESSEESDDEDDENKSKGGGEACENREKLIMNNVELSK